MDEKITREIQFGARTTLVGNGEQGAGTASASDSDQRYKTDILLVVAHPDDEGAATPYLARALTNTSAWRGLRHARSSVSERSWREQAAALGAVREIEARNALTTLGITNVWFLTARIRPRKIAAVAANWIMASRWNTVRLVRLTRPEVILTFLPGTFIGEDPANTRLPGKKVRITSGRVSRTSRTSCSSDSP